MKFEDINLLIISALYSKAMSLFKTQAEQTAVIQLSSEQSSSGAQVGKPAHGLLRLREKREKSQLTEEAFSDKLTNFLSFGDDQGA